MTTTSSSPVNSLWVRAGLPVLILLGGIVAFVVLSRVYDKSPDTTSGKAPVPIVRSVIVRNHRGGMTLDADGVVVPFREITIAAEVAGRVVERSKACRAGRYVTTGTPLVKIDPQDYQLEVERLEKELQQATVALDELEQDLKGVASLIEISVKELDLRTRESKRMQGLKGAVTSTDLERAEVNELTARSALLSYRNRQRLLNVGRGRLEGARDLAQVKLKKAQLDLRRTEIVAPVDGVITADLVEQDTYVTKGTPLASLQDTSHVEVKCKLEMEDLYWLWDRRRPSAEPAAPDGPSQAYDIPDTEVEVIYSLSGHDRKQYIWDGRLARFDGLGLDEKTRTVPCRVMVDDPLKRRSVDNSGPPALLRGMYVGVRIRVNPETPLLEIPEEAVRPGNRVWRVRKGKLAIIPVHFVTVLDDSGDGPPTDRLEAGNKRSRNALVYVDDASLLSGGDKVVTSPLTMVRSGMTVQMAKEAKGTGRDQRSESDRGPRRQAAGQNQAATAAEREG